ncbi:MAG: hypothetical protein ABIE07_01735 [Candidatus Zixiibacteriota bacterium]
MRKATNTNLDRLDSNDVFDECQYLLTDSLKLQSTLDRGRGRIQNTGGISHKNFWREIERQS